MNGKEAIKKIIIPGKPEEIDRSRAHGDIGSGVRFELSGKEGYFDQLPDSATMQQFIKNGGRVFITENDDYLLIDPQTSDEPIS